MNAMCLNFKYIIDAKIRRRLSIRKEKFHIPKMQNWYEEFKANNSKGERRLGSNSLEAIENKSRAN